MTTIEIPTEQIPFLLLFAGMLLLCASFMLLTVAIWLQNRKLQRILQLMTSKTVSPTAETQP